MCGMVGPNKVVLSRLKRFAVDALPSESILRHVILEEPDQMDPEVFLAKMSTWLLIAKLGLG
jgi:hypothetical protein